MKFSRNILRNYSVLLALSPRNAPIKAELRNLKRKPVKILGLRSPYDKVAGLVYFGRMVDQIRAHANGKLPPDYQANLGKGLEEHCANFLGVTYHLVVQYANEGLSDEAILESCFSMGH